MPLRNSYLVRLMRTTRWIEEPLYSQIRQLIPLACVDLLVVHRGQLLIMKRINSPAKGEWFTPGARIFIGESIEEAVKRTLKEETGLQSTEIEQKGIMSHIWPEVHTITVIHKVKVKDNIITLNPEHQDYKWIDTITNDLHPYLKEMIEMGEIFSIF